MCIIISRSLHAYFTTFDMILKYILTYSGVSRISFRGGGSKFFVKVGVFCIVLYCIVLYYEALY